MKPLESPDSRTWANGKPRYTSENEHCKNCQEAFECSNGMNVSCCNYLKFQERSKNNVTNVLRNRNQRISKKGWSDPN